MDTDCTGVPRQWMQGTCKPTLGLFPSIRNRANTWPYRTHLSIHAPLAALCALLMHLGLQTPLLRDLDRNLFCVSCQAPILIGEPAEIQKQVAAGLISVPSLETAEKRATSMKKEADIGDASRDRHEKYAELRDFLDDRPPPNPRTASKGSQISSIMGQKLLAGWRMNEECCATCNVPTMTPPGSSELVCLSCSASGELPTAAASSMRGPALDRHDQKATDDMSAMPAALKADRKVSKTDEVSKRMGPKLLSGWKMNAQACATCDVPLMTPKGDTKQFCVYCEKWYDSTGQPIGTAPASASAAALKASTPAPSPARAPAPVVAATVTTTSPSSVSAAAKAKVLEENDRDDEDDEWQRAYEEVQSGLLVDARYGPQARKLQSGASTTAAAAVEPPSAARPVSRDVPAGGASVVLHDNIGPSGRVVPLGAFEVKMPTDAEIRRLAIALENAEKSDSAFIHANGTHTSTNAISTHVNQNAATTTASSATSGGVIPHTEAAIQTLQQVIGEHNARIQQLRDSPDQLVAVAARIPALVDALLALRKL